MSINSNNIKFLHSCCFFEKSTRNSNGGAIYFQCQSSIVQHRFCTKYTYTTSGYGFHSYTDLKDNKIDRQNYIVECSISSCSQISSSELLYFNYGNCGIFASNITKNDVNFYSGFYIENARGLALINFSTFEENDAKDCVCLNHHISPVGYYEDYMCNIVKNTQSGTFLGIIFANNDMTVKNCTVFGPYGKGKPFAKNGDFAVINCHVDDITCYDNGGPGIFSSSGIIFDKSQIILSHLSTYNCHAHNSLEKNVINHNKNDLTCKENLSFILISRLYYNSIIVFCYL